MCRNTKTIRSMLGGAALAIVALGVAGAAHAGGRTATTVPTIPTAPSVGIGHPTALGCKGVAAGPGGVMVKIEIRNAPPYGSFPNDPEPEVLPAGRVVTYEVDYGWNGWKSGKFTLASAVAKHGNYQGGQLMGKFERCKAWVMQ